MMQKIEELTSVSNIQRWRMTKNSLARFFIFFGGIGVIIAVLLIFFYLLYAVFPLFLPASVDKQASYSLSNNINEKTIHLSIEEQNTVGFRLDRLGHITFFDIANGKLISEHDLGLGAGVSISSVAVDDGNHDLLALGLSNGKVLLFQHEYKLIYNDDNTRTIEPSIDFLYGENPITLKDVNAAIEKIALSAEEEQLLLAVVANGKSYLLKLEIEENILTETREITQQFELIDYTGGYQNLVDVIISGDQRWLYFVGAGGSIHFYNIKQFNQIALLQQLDLYDDARTITTVNSLVGGTSLLVGDSIGMITQLFPVRDENQEYQLGVIRSFDAGKSEIKKILSEQRRKGFIALTDHALTVFHSTATRRVQEITLDQNFETSNIALSPRSNQLLLEKENNQIEKWYVDNPHPDISFSALWNQVWYENYSEPEYTWQSSAANNDFEPKYSLMPLTFGTIKAASYAMLFAIPIAIMGAIYTACFMAPPMRRLIKPTIEIMEALPTVILGFLAGLWLAPYVESNLAGIFTLIIILPIGLLLFAFLWMKSPFKHYVKDGWQPLLLVPVLILVSWLALDLGQLMQVAFFDGSLSQWVTVHLGIDFDQRNSMVVGIAMGFAVIPTIFSLTEDALFSVPKSLSNGSLALGATSWQTLVLVILPTASPGIFSALMMGLGRAVGETMIVLMATGNTPLMDLNIFEGMRTLSANIAVEMPESELNSTHYRILFLAGLVLFMFTFVVNTVAETVRQRLRQKYSSL